MPGSPTETGPIQMLSRQDGWIGVRTVTNAGRRLAAIALFKIGRKLGLRQTAGTAEPHLVDSSVAPANALDSLAMAGETISEAEAAAILAGNRNFAGIRERVR